MIRLSDLWTNDRDTSKDAEGWNARADTFSGPIVPSDDPFVRLIMDKAQPDRGSTEILDIGCGTGRFSLAFAEVSKKILGFDISSVMVSTANHRPETRKHPDAKFVTGDWNSLDVSKIGMFDITIANMTPAICSKLTMEKMVSVSRGWCFLSGYVSRGEKLWKELHRLSGSGQGSESDKLLYAMDYLWSRDMRPEILYHSSHQNRTMPLDYAEKFFIESSRVMYGDDEERDRRIMDILESLSDGETVTMDSEPVSAMLYWHV